MLQSSRSSKESKLPSRLSSREEKLVGFHLIFEIFSPKTAGFIAWDLCDFSPLMSSLLIFVWIHLPAIATVGRTAVGQMKSFSVVRVHSFLYECVWLRHPHSLVINHIIRNPYAFGLHVSIMQSITFRFLSNYNWSKNNIHSSSQLHNGIGEQVITPCRLICSLEIDTRPDGETHGWQSTKHQCRLVPFLKFTSLEHLEVASPVGSPVSEAPQPASHLHHPTASHPLIWAK